MKNLLGIVILSLFLSLNAFAKTIGDEKTVNYYLSEEGYTLHSTDIITSGQYLYHLEKKSSTESKIMSCAFFVKVGNTVCFIP
tara:strand:+ start:536 stop:784 length:249 start_codon:yes stop_codon:yes gene_type:complete